MFSKVFRIILPLIILSSGAFGTWILISQKSGPQLRPSPQKNVPLVQVIQTKKHEGAISIESHATTKADATFSIAAQVGGRVIWVNPEMKEGKKIVKNALLFKIDPTDYQLQVQQAKATLIEKQYDLDLVLAKQNAAIKEYEAYRKTNGLSGNSEDNTGLSRLAKYEPQVESAIGALESAKAGLKIAELELERTIVNAPTNGYFSSVGVNEGQIIVANNSVAELIKTEPIILKVPVPLTDLQWLTFEGNHWGRSLEESKAVISRKVGSVNHQWEGTIKRRLSEIDDTGRKAILIVEVNQVRSNHGLDLPVGLFVNVSLQGSFHRDVIEIPIETFRSNSSVWTVNADNRLEIRQVTVAKQTEQSAFISTGLTVDEQLVTSAITGPIPGMALRIFDEQQPLVQADNSPALPENQGATGALKPGIDSSDAPDVKEQARLIIPHAAEAGRNQINKIAEQGK